jgi:hypothetical protein
MKLAREGFVQIEKLKKKGGKYFFAHLRIFFEIISKNKKLTFYFPFSFFHFSFWRREQKDPKI